ncbi:hypothetical protein SERLA73DRAFT_80391 [Serpula lacrymans var. lacrymans S7.3]|uniref:Uncharacterized protein n=2 Tax=Serpula lacrymans var. lacrymans TaxID=341189 RepID=F8QJL5_SERL3|nr:uncharacterized protein SERLADRAFT_434794 [Serpula lacrymans var. lacrymans S7.9]XP_007315105.1 uncharacterized protein SERLADRAFT_434795 [Serpula lacrymans var. lacrymans S7.9]EGN91504.1 hypothetical protein SERLA73DRAFT_80391 [Serpula lacrymans var. lacrymans S7.3]EGO28905.1 hypothetical protein SERLADRAFT_434794 [Serpula lacrymans var. lacrymans S7.9]EGO28906.1 hypothetical protein SERLADRAFT_434795 [Serpula lacrymans var. lacrymans S7.9]
MPAHYNSRVNYHLSLPDPRTAPFQVNSASRQFFDLCGVEKTAKQDERIQALVDNLQPYPDDAPFMKMGPENKAVWKSCWTEKIDHTVNVHFVNEIVDCVWDNETALRTVPGGKPELVDADYNKDVIIKMKKLYWGNLQSQVKARAGIHQS